MTNNPYSLPSFIVEYKLKFQTAVFSIQEIPSVDPYELDTWTSISVDKQQCPIPANSLSLAQ